MNLLISQTLFKFHLKISINKTLPKSIQNLLIVPEKCKGIFLGIELIHLQNFINFASAIEVTFSKSRIKLFMNCQKLNKNSSKA